MPRWLPLIAALAALALPAAAPGVVPPKDCGRITADGRRFQVKADQISCRTAKAHVRRYYATGRRPGGYRGRTNPPRRSAVALYCSAQAKVFFAIRR